MLSLTLILAAAKSPKGAALIIDPVSSSQPSGGRAAASSSGKNVKAIPTSQQSDDAGASGRQEAFQERVNYVPEGEAALTAAEAAVVAFVKVWNTYYYYR